jgi:N-acetylmuramoyl-L-alanine amidase
MEIFDVPGERAPRRLPLIFVVLLCTSLLFLPGPSDNSEAASRSGANSRRFKPKIVDYQKHLSSNFRHKKRKVTRYIIVHTSEAGLKSTLRTLSRGKVYKGCYVSTGGHANYAVARNGVIYRILNHKYRANHAGLSMWNGETDISSVSVGIELVGYHYGVITDAQYRSVRWLLDVLQKIYGIHDRNVLTHSQVAYGRPNRWHGYEHRGRKRCAKNFNRAKAGLRKSWSYDPDVRAGRLVKDVHLANIFYAPGSRKAKTREAIASNVISAANTAWSIAGEDYDAQDTSYVLPNGKTLRGDEVENALGWNKIPAGTRVLLNVPVYERIEAGPVKIIEEGKTAWSLVGPDYRKSSTFYFLPNGKVLSGNRVSDWDSLPSQTRMISGYRGPYKLGRGKHPVKVVGARYKHDETVYLYPNNRLYAANEIPNWTRMPVGTRVFVRTN